MKRIERSSQFLKELFATYKKFGVDYCILRNYKKLYLNNSNWDIDILIDRRHVSTNHQVLKRLCSDFDFELYLKRNVTSQQFMILAMNRGENIYMILDFLTKIDWWGFSLVSGEDILSSKVRYEDFYVPSEEYEVLITWIYPFISGGMLKHKYRNKIAEIASRLEFQETLGGYVGEDLAIEMSTYLKNGDFEGIKKRRRKARLKIIFNNFKCIHFTFLKNLFLTVINAAVNYVSPKGVFIAVLGPDGSGKSTLIELVRGRFDRKVFPHVVVRHWRCEVLPSLSELFTGQDSGKNPALMGSPHEAKPASFFSSFLRLLYYSLDFLLGYYLIIKKRLYEGNLVMFDRYFHDFCVDPWRSRIKLSNIFPYIIAKTLPHPDIIFCLTTTPLTVLNRKKELSIKEIERQIMQYKKLCSRFSYCIEIDAGKDPEINAKEFEDLIIEKWKKKLKRL